MLIYYNIIYNMLKYVNRKDVHSSSYFITTATFSPCFTIYQIFTIDMCLTLSFI